MLSSTLTLWAYLYIVRFEEPYLPCIYAWRIHCSSWQLYSMGSVSISCILCVLPFVCHVRILNCCQKLTGLLERIMCQEAWTYSCAEWVLQSYSGVHLPRCWFSVGSPFGYWFKVALNEAVFYILWAVSWGHGKKHQQLQLGWVTLLLWSVCFTPLLEITNGVYAHTSGAPVQSPLQSKF